MWSFTLQCKILSIPQGTDSEWISTAVATAVYCNKKYQIQVTPSFSHLHFVVYFLVPHLNLILHLVLHPLARASWFQGWSG